MNPCIEEGTIKMKPLAATAIAAIGIFAVAAPAAWSCPNDELRQGAAAFLPDCRAYEQVSPTDKNGFDVQSAGELANNPAVSPEIVEAGGVAAGDGSAVAFRSDGPFADAAFGGNFRHFYLARRDATGWQTRSLLPRVTPAANGTGSYSVAAFNPDLSASLLYVSNSTLLDDPAERTDNLYLRSNVSGLTTLLAASPTILTGSAGSLIAASADLDHAVFATASKMSGEPGQPEIEDKVYEATGGIVRLVSRQPGDDSPFLTYSGIGDSNGLGRSAEGAVSDDGASVFFANPSDALFGPRVLYRRSGGATVVASPSKRTPPDPNQWPIAFQMATGDGNRVFFSSPRRLSDDANEYPFSGELGDLYRYDFVADRLVNLSAGTSGVDPANATMVGASADGGRTYFVATGQVVPGQGDAAPAPKLYLWEDDGSAQGAVRYVATLSTVDPGGASFPRDSDNWSWEGKRRSQVDADGRLVFQSRADLDGPGGFDPAGTAQVYLYDPAAAGGAGDLACVSCPPSGVPAGSALVAARENGFGRDRPRFLSADGRQVFFTSPDPLAARDANAKLDAYVWQRSSAAGEPLAGTTSLLSTGRSGDDSFFHGATADGRSAFFRTREQLVAQDRDTLEDLYVASVDGGLAAQQDEGQPACQGDACQGPPVPAPEPRGGATESFDGAGNLRAPAGRARLLPLSARQRGLLASGRAVMVRVRVPRAGRVSLVGRASLGGRRRIVTRGGARARGAGQLRVRLRLGPAARRHLRAGRRLRLVLGISAPGGAQPRSVTFGLRRPR